LEEDREQTFPSRKIRQRNRQRLLKA
jgi:hypothetical protein